MKRILKLIHKYFSYQQLVDKKTVWYFILFTFYDFEYHNIVFYNL